MPTTDLKGRTFFVTGANSGIGRAMVEALAQRGGNVVLAARSEERTRPVLEGIRSRSQGVRAEFVHVDVSDLGSVRRAAAAYLASGSPIDVLVNNAGIAGTQALSADGFDLTYATNYIGPFVLTDLLLPRVQESKDGRIVNVASVGHKYAKQMDWTGLERRTTPRRSGFPEYAVTKLMNILHAKELARRLEGTRVTTYSLHPGAVATNVWRSIPPFLQWAMKLFMLSNEEGARTPLWCATDPGLKAETGRYYDRGREARPSQLAEDVGLARELWTRTETAVGGGGS